MAKRSIFDDLRDNLKLLVSNPGQFKQGAQLGVQARTQQVANSRFNVPAQVKAATQIAKPVVNSYVQSANKRLTPQQIGGALQPLYGAAPFQIQTQQFIQPYVNKVANKVQNVAAKLPQRLDLGAQAQAAFHLGKQALTGQRSTGAIVPTSHIAGSLVKGILPTPEDSTEVRRILLTKGLKNLTKDEQSLVNNRLLNTIGGINLSAPGLRKGFKLPDVFEKPKNQVEATNLNYIAQNFDKVSRDYDSLVTKKYGTPNYISADEAKEVIPGYKGSNAPDYHEASSGLAKAKYAEKLQLNKGQGNNTVMFTAGGTGVGKTTGLRGAGVKLNDYPVIYDTNLSGLESSTKKIQSALDNGYQVEIKFVSRDPIASFEFGVLPRTKRTGRVVTIEEHLNRHTDSLTTLQELKRKFGDSLSVKYYDNNKPGAPIVDFNELPRYNYSRNELQTILKQKLKQSVSNQELTPDQARAIEGTDGLVLGESNPQLGSGEVGRPVPEVQPTQELTGLSPQSPSPTLVDKTPQTSSLPSEQSVADPVNRIIQAIKGAQPVRGSQEALYRAERAKRAARVAGVGRSVSGEQGYFAQLGQLKGELPKVQFESIRKELSQENVDTLFNKIRETPYLSPFEQVNAQSGLAKLIGAEGGTVPTKGELSLLKEIYGKEFVEAVLEKRPLFEKVMATVGDLLNVPRSIMSTADLSAPLRQGVFLIGRPKQFVPAFRDMFKYAFNPKAYEGFMESVKARPTYKQMRESRLALTEMGTDLAQREEAFMSNLIERIPGLGEIAKGSNRAYSGFLNKLRADTFDDLLKTAKSQGIDRPGLGDDIAKFVNSATGRGDIGALSKAAPVLNGIFFSPRLIASRMNLLNPVYYAKLDPFVRKEALKSLLTFAGTGLTVLGLAKLGGAQVGEDPRSADFGKIKIGNTRYDTWGGFQQYFRLAGQLISGQLVNSTTGRITTLGEGYRPLTRYEIALKFFESKENPVFSLATQLLKGQDFEGKPIDLKSEVAKRFVPLVIQDMAEVIKERGVAAAAGNIPSFFGVGTQTYGPKEGTAFYYYQKLKDLPPEEANKQAAELKKNDPSTYSQLSKIVKQQKAGLSAEEISLGDYGVENHERSRKIAVKVNKMKTPEEKNQYIKKLQDGGVITPQVYDQLKQIFYGGQ